jgi:sugar lactone lactonase YvrE
MRDDPVVGLDLLETFAYGLDHPEGIAVAPDGQLYVGGEAGQIYAIGDDGSVKEVASTGGFNLGLAADSSGRLYESTPRQPNARFSPRASQSGRLRCRTGVASTVMATTTCRTQDAGAIPTGLCGSCARGARPRFGPRKQKLSRTAAQSHPTGAACSFWRATRRP